MESHTKGHQILFKITIILMLHRGKVLKKKVKKWPKIRIFTSFSLFLNISISTPKMKKFIPSRFLMSIWLPVNKIKEKQFMKALEESHNQFKALIMNRIIICFILYKFLITLHIFILYVIFVKIYQILN